VPDQSPVAVLVRVTCPADGHGDEDSLDELARLADTAGWHAALRVVQERQRPDPATFVGRGKLGALKQEVERLSAGAVIFDDELSPAQVRNIEDELGCRVIDRTQLILDIFAQRAQSREGKVQVELARLTYLLPRLAGRGVELSRLGGGIGTRGPGETKLEIDRREVRRRIQALRRELDTIAHQRRTRREERRREPWPLLALVGYTNAGKSTLLNALTGAQARAEDRLFATLDPMVRGMVLPSGERVLIADTVGFLRRLPHDLVAAFRATLDEVTESDLLLHVVDASHPDFDTQMETVLEVLSDLGAGDRTVITVFNKCDLLPAGSLEPLVDRWAPAVAVSALTGSGVELLGQTIDATLSSGRERVLLQIPYAKGSLIRLVHEKGRVLSASYGPDTVALEAELARPWAGRLLRQLDQGEQSR